MFCSSCMSSNCPCVEEEVYIPECNPDKIEDKEDISDSYQDTQGDIYFSKIKQNIK